MRRFFVLASVCFALLLGCSDGDGQGAGARVKNPDVVVAFLPLTGDLAFLGVPGQRAIQMALDDIRQRTGRDAPFRVEIVDTKADPKEAVTRYAETQARFDAKLFITTLTGVSEAVKPLIARDGGLQLVVAISPKVMDGAGNAIRFCFNAAQEARELSTKLARSKDKIIGLLVSKDPTSISETEEYLIPALKATEVQYVRHDFDVGQKNFRSILQSFKDRGANKLVVLGYGSDFPAILKQLATIDAKGMISILGGIGLVEFPGWSDADYLNRSIEFVGPTISIDGLLKSQANLVALRYAKTYGEKYMPYDGAFTYDAISALASALTQGPASPTELRNRVISWKTYRGVVGDIAFQPNGDVVTPMSWAHYKNGRLSVGEMVNAK